MSKMKRYQQVIQQVKKYAPKTILEIGTWNGVRAEQMSVAALEASPKDKVHYTGYDLFEDLTPELRKLERHGKDNPKMKSATSRLDRLVEKYNGRFSYELIKGNTRETLKEGTVVDFVYLDGGHSLETIESDYNAVKESKVVLFDDYYAKDADGKLIHDTELYGCNKLIDGLPNKVILPAFDVIKPGGLLKQALVVKV